ncbi:MAG: type VII toxin-antitoxin system MntA family adenylyltransferase antitoxin [Anaerolineales bacterium]
MKYTLKSSQKEVVVKKISATLHRECDDITVAYLFGSFVTEDTFSDIDLGVVTNIEPNSPLNYEFNLESKLESVIKYPMDIRILNRAPLSFCQNVIRNGRIVLDRDPNSRADFEGLILKQYFDFAPFRRRYLSEVKNAPV